MFGISPLGWLHTLGSLPAIPLALFMLLRHGRIVPRSHAGAAYFITMLIGGATVFLVAKQPISYAIGLITLLFLAAGYGAGLVQLPGRAARYIETLCLSITVFLLLLPAVSETLRRVPDGHPIVSGPEAPLLLATQAAMLAALVLGIAAQFIYLRRASRKGTD